MSKRVLCGERVLECVERHLKVARNIYVNVYIGMGRIQDWPYSLSPLPALFFRCFCAWGKRESKGTAFFELCK